MGSCEIPHWVSSLGRRARVKPFLSLFLTVSTLPYFTLLYLTLVLIREGILMLSRSLSMSLMP